MSLDVEGFSDEEGGGVVSIGLGLQLDPKASLGWICEKTQWSSYGKLPITAPLLHKGHFQYSFQISPKDCLKDTKEDVSMPRKARRDWRNFMQVGF